MRDRVLEILTELKIDTSLEIEEIGNTLEVKLSQVNKRLRMKPGDAVLSTQYNLITEGIKLIKLESSEGAEGDKPQDTGLSEKLEAGLGEKSEAGLTEKSEAELAEKENTPDEQEEFLHEEPDTEEISEPEAYKSVKDKHSQALKALILNFVSLYWGVKEIRLLVFEAYSAMLPYAHEDVSEYLVGELDADKQEKIQSKETSLYIWESTFTNYEKLVEKYRTASEIHGYPIEGDLKEENDVASKFLEAVLHGPMKNASAVDVYGYKVDGQESIKALIGKHEVARVLNAMYLHETYQSEKILNQERYYGENQGFATYYRALHYLENGPYYEDQCKDVFDDLYYCYHYFDIEDYEGENAKCVTKYMNECVRGIAFIYKKMHDQKFHDVVDSEKLCEMMELTKECDPESYKLYQEDKKINALSEKKDISGLIGYYRELATKESVDAILKIYDEQNEKNRKVIFNALHSDAQNKDKEPAVRKYIYEKLIALEKSTVEGEVSKAKLLLELCYLEPQNSKAQGPLIELYNKYTAADPAVAYAFFNDIYEDGLGFKEGAYGLALLYRNGYPNRNIDKTIKYAMISGDIEVLNNGKISSSSVLGDGPSRLFKEAQAEKSGEAAYEHACQLLETSEFMEGTAQLAELATSGNCVKAAYKYGRLCEEGYKHIKKDMQMATKCYAIALVRSRGRFKPLKRVLENPTFKKDISALLKSGSVEVPYAKATDMSVYWERLNSGYGYGEEI